MEARPKIEKEKLDFLKLIARNYTGEFHQFELCEGFDFIPGVGKVPEGKRDLARFNKKLDDFIWKLIYAELIDKNDHGYILTDEGEELALAAIPVGEKS